jgi:plasmid stabilization system protein ParE
MISDDDGPARRYQVVRSERAEKDLDDAFLRRNGLLGPRAAGEWLKELDYAIDDLANFPGPRSHAIDDFASNRFGLEVRRMLYHGPGKQHRSGTPYRVLFTIIEPAPDEGIIRVLRILHGASEPFGPEPNDEESA